MNDPFDLNMDNTNIIELYQSLSNEMKTRRSIVLDLVGKNGMLLKYLPQRFKDDKDIVLAALNSPADKFEVFQHIPDLLKIDPDVKQALEQMYKSDEYSSLYLASEEVKHNKNVILSVIERDGSALRHASPELKNDRNIVLSAIVNLPDAEKSNSDYINQAIAFNEKAFLNPPEFLKDFTKEMSPEDRDLVYAGYALDTPPVDPSVSASLDDMFKL